MNRHRSVFHVACLLLFLSFGQTAHAASLTLAWDSSTATNVAGYVIRYGTQSGSYVTSLDAGSQTIQQVNGLSDNTVYYFVVQAYTVDGTVSSPSAEVSGLTAAALPDAISSVTLATNVSAPQNVGTTIAWTAASNGGVAPYAYRWWLSSGGSTTALTNWTSSNTYSWTPKVAGSYDVIACARSAWNTSDTAEACLSVRYDITQPPTVSLTTNLAAPQTVGTTIQWTATPAGGTAPYQYRWWLSTTTTSDPLSGWVSSNSFSWTPSAANSYVMTVWVRSAGNTVDAPEMSQSAAFTISNVRPGKCRAAKCR